MSNVSKLYCQLSTPHTTLKTNTIILSRATYPGAPDYGGVRTQVNTIINYILMLNTHALTIHKLMVGRDNIITISN